MPLSDSACKNAHKHAKAATGKAFTLFDDKGVDNLADSIAVDNALTKSFQQVLTRLNGFNEKEQGHLINWGYALADSAIRKHAKELLAAGTYSETSWPIVGFPL